MPIHQFHQFNSPAPDREDFSGAQDRNPGFFSLPGVSTIPGQVSGILSISLGGLIFSFKNFYNFRLRTGKGEFWLLGLLEWHSE